jgi:hypothetical protein
MDYTYTRSYQNQQTHSPTHSLSHSVTPIMAKRNKRRSKKNRVVRDTTSKENVGNAMPTTKKPDDDAPLFQKTAVFEENGVLAPQIPMDSQKEEKLIPPQKEVEEGEIVEIFEQVGDREIRMEDMSASKDDDTKNQGEHPNLKQVMEQAKLDLKHAGFPGIMGFVFDPVRDMVLTPALGLSAEIVPAVADKIPLAETVGAHALGAVFGAIKFGYGILPHKEVTTDGMPSQ